MRLVAIASLFAVWMFAGSARASEPSVSQCIEANERAIALRKQLHFHEARAAASTCSISSCPSEIREECVRRIDEIASVQPSVVFEVQDDSGSDMSAVDVELDGVPAGRLDGSALPIDPGSHEFVFTSRGKQTVRRSFVLREGEKDRLERIVMRAVAPPPAANAPALTPSRRSPVFRAAGVGVAGLGLVSVGLGVFFGLRAGTLWSRSQSECGDAKPCTAADHARAVQDHDSASSAATLSTVAFAGGAGAIAVGATLFFLAPVVSTKTAGVDVGLRF